MNLLQTDIMWSQLKALHQVYVKKQTKAPLLNNAFIKRLKTEKRLLRHKPGNMAYIIGTAAYPAFYREHFLLAYERYVNFFTTTGIESDGRRSYSLYDLETLSYIYKNKEVLKVSLTTERSFSAQVFKGSKYLENNQSVLAAVLIILEIDKFPKSDPKEQRWRLVIDCPNPQRIVLCENLAALKYPDLAIELQTELWYVGGNNTKILENLSSDKLVYPIYYMCDWDYDGLRIYENVLSIMETKGKKIQLLFPYDLTKKVPTEMLYHDSKWKRQLHFSGLSEEKYSKKEIDLINYLIIHELWIEEESQDFAKLLTNNGVL